MSVWRPIDETALNGRIYAVLFREPACKEFPHGYQYWHPRALFDKMLGQGWVYLDHKSVFDKWVPIPEGHFPTHYVDMSVPDNDPWQSYGSSPDAEVVRLVAYKNAHLIPSKNEGE